MAVTNYQNERGETLWKMYLNLRSKKNLTIRVQKLLIGFKSKEEAEIEERKHLIELSKKLERLENEGATWDVVIDKWERDKLTYGLDGYVKSTVIDYANMLRNWTKLWSGRPAHELTRGDGREILRMAQGLEKPTTFLVRLRNTINLVYTWGIEERLIIGVHHSPVYGIDLGRQKEEKLPEIYTRDQVRSLIHQAEMHNHKWHNVWKGAVLTGMRSGELLALPWQNLEMITEAEAFIQDELSPEKRRYGLIRVLSTWNTREKKFGPTKGGYWRTIPISKELYWFLAGIKKETGETGYVFPRFWEWEKGQQAQVLRKFCLDVGLPSIKFHTLRAIFGTLLIQSGVAPTRVMKICGWKDLKTMQRYIRMAGIDEQGATEALNLFPTDNLPNARPRRFASGSVSDQTTYSETDEEIMDRVVNLFDFRNRSTNVAE